MNAALRLRGGHALHAVNAAFVFQRAVHVGSRHGADDFLEAAGCSLAGTRHFELPAFPFAIFGVHPEQVAGKECGFVATRAAAYFENGVLAVLGVFRHQHEFDAFFQLRNALLARGHFFAGHFLHLGIVFMEQDVFAFFEVGQGVGVAFAGLHEVFQFLILLGEPHVAGLVGNHRGVGDERGNFLEAGLQTVELFQQCVVFCHWS